MRTLMGLVIAVLLASAPLTHAAGMPQEAGDSKTAVATVNLNTASASQLESLPGIGAKMAQRIVDTGRRTGRSRRSRI